MIRQFFLEIIYEPAKEIKRYQLGAGIEPGDGLTLIRGWEASANTFSPHPSKEWVSTNGEPRKKNKLQRN